MRWLGWLSKLLISVLLISCLTVFTTAYIVDLYIKEVLAQWGMSDTIHPTVDAEDYVSKLINPSQLWNQEDSTPVNSTVEEDGVNDGNIAKANGWDSAEKDDTGVEGDPVRNDNLEVDDPGLPVFNQGQESELRQENTQSLNEASSSSKLKETLIMSAQEFNEKRKKLTQADKSEIFSIVIAKFPQEELQKMSLLLEDGITEKEWGDLENVMNAYLEQEEVEKLLTILNKY